MIQYNLIETGKLLIAEAEGLGAELDDIDDSVTLINDIDPNDCFDLDNSTYTAEEILDALKAVWGNEQIQEVFRISNSPQILDNIKYFFDKIDDVFSEDYLPSDEDILKTRNKTIGITRNNMKAENHNVLLIDLGGQMSERNKYKSITEEVDALIYTISLCDYNRMMYENSDKSRKDDQFELFNYFAENEKYSGKPVFLICNKADLFKDKIENSNTFREAFPDFVGDEQSPVECANYYIESFKKIAEEKGIELWPFAISAIDSDNVRSTIHSILDSFF